MIALCKFIWIVEACFIIVVFVMYFVIGFVQISSFVTCNVICNGEYQNWNKNIITLYSFLCYFLIHYVMQWSYHLFHDTSTIYRLLTIMVRFWAVQNLFWAGRCVKLGLNPPFTAQICPKLPKTAPNCLKLPTDYESAKLILGEISNLLSLNFLMLKFFTSNVFTV